MRILKIIIITLLIALVNQSISQSKRMDALIQERYPKARVNYKEFNQLVQEVDSHRAKRLVSFNQFLNMAKDSNTVILDTRSKLRYNRKHVKGAIHLNFSDFTQDALYQLIPPHPKTRILIYCNNNFDYEELDMPSKAFIPKKFELEIKKISLDLNSKALVDFPAPKEERTLALNIPTYINLYGYGYRNIYELDELVSIFDKRLEMEGTEVAR